MPYGISSVFMEIKAYRREYHAKVGDPAPPQCDARLSTQTYCISRHIRRSAVRSGPFTLTYF
jgi:hypothetical protein